MPHIAYNPAVAEHLLSQFGDHADALSAMITQLNQSVNDHVGGDRDGWQGRQADSFNSAWNGQWSPSLENLVVSLRDARSYILMSMQAYRDMDEH